MSILDTIAATIQNPFSTTVKNNGARAQDFPGGFEVVEFVQGIAQDGTGGVGSRNTAVTLYGPSMPMQPFPWSGEQRLTRDYYPGNPEPAVQVLGAKEGDLVIHGRFKDKHYRDPSYYGAAYELAKAFDGIRKRGNLVRFGMHGPTANWIRYGFLEKVDFKMNKLSWIDYEITFLVMSDTQPKNNFFASPEQTSPDSVNQNLLNAITAFNQNFSSVPKSVPKSIADELNSAIGTVASAVASVTNFVGTVISTAQSVVNSANRALGLIKNARANISQFSRQIDSITHSFTSHSSSGIASSRARDTYLNFIYLAETRAAIVPVSQYLAKMQAQFEQIAKTLPKARYKVQVGDTLQKISIRFYGISDNWKSIYDHNSLTNTTLIVGTILEIPK